MHNAGATAPAVVLHKVLAEPTVMVGFPPLKLAYGENPPYPLSPPVNFIDGVARGW